jgi:hypothetical protein
MFRRRDDFMMPSEMICSDRFKIAHSPPSCVYNNMFVMAFRSITPAGELLQNVEVSMLTPLRANLCG